MSLVLHHLNRSRSERLIWLLEELGVAYELVRHKRDPQVNLAPAELIAIHPMGKAPLLIHDGQVIAESGAIALHLLEHFDTDHRLHPAPGAGGGQCRNARAGAARWRRIRQSPGRHESEAAPCPWDEWR